MLRSLALSALLLSGASLVAADSSPHYYFIFGDSYSTSGFNWTGVQPSHDLPFGNKDDFNLTNGQRSWADIFGEHVGGFQRDYRIYNYAGYDSVVNRSIANIDSFPGSPSLQEQVEEFIKTRAGPNKDWNGTSATVGISIGATDLGNIDDPQAHIDDVISGIQTSLLRQLEELYGAGLRQFFFVDLAPLYLAPAFIAESKEPNELPTWLEMLDGYNFDVNQTVASFQKLYPDAVVPVFSQEYLYQILPSDDWSSNVINVNKYANSSNDQEGSGAAWAASNDNHGSSAINNEVANNLINFLPASFKFG
ncbi:MAG: hypothetical protein M1838_000727 [Thelocarpon superellum]|nr:MAG: hypothetical protein M1838_000727 [Thelocarpon superellum]